MGFVMQALEAPTVPIAQETRLNKPSGPVVFLFVCLGASLHSKKGPAAKSWAQASNSIRRFRELALEIPSEVARALWAWWEAAFQGGRRWPQDFLLFPCLPTAAPRRPRHHQTSLEQGTLPAVQLAVWTAAHLPIYSLPTCLLGLAVGHWLPPV